MKICANNLPLSETERPYHFDSNENNILSENICQEDNFVRAISINSFRCEKTVCEIITFAHIFCKSLLSIVSSSSEELQKSPSMYGAFNPVGNTQYHNGNVKYYSPSDLSKICRQNTDSHSIRDSDKFIQQNSEHIEQAKQKKHHEEKYFEEKSRKKANKEKKQYKKENKDYGVYCMMPGGEDEKKEKNSKRDKKEFSQLNYFDLQCILNDCDRNTSIPSNAKREKHSEHKKHQRSQSIDQIPTKDVPSERKFSGRTERPKSAERRDFSRIERDTEFDLKYYLPNSPSNSFQIYEQEKNIIIPHQLIPNQQLSKRHKEKSRKKKKTSGDVEIPEFVTVDQINEQTMNIKDEKFEHHNHKQYRRGTGKNVRHHQQREFYDEYNQQNFQHNLDSLYNEQDLSPNENNKIIEDNHHSMVNISGMNRPKIKERKKEKNKDHRNKTMDKEYRTLKKYIKKLAKEQQNETFQFTKQYNDESPHDERVQRDRRFLEENLLNFDTDFYQNQKMTDSNSDQKQARKEFIPFDFGLDELQIPPKIHRKKHDLKKKKNKKKITNSESSERIRSTSLSMKKKYQNLNDKLKKRDQNRYEEMETSLKTKCKSETSLNSTVDDKNIICIYRNKDDKEDAKTIKLMKKHECLSIDTATKCDNNEVSEYKERKEKEHSPYDENQMVLPIEDNKKLSDVLKMRERSLFFRNAMRKDFPSRPRPRLNHSRQRSSKFLAKEEDIQYNNNNMHVGEEPTKEVYCYDVGTSTILDNNFKDVLELLKGDPLIKSPCSSKKRSVFHVKKNTSREDLIESATKASDDGDQTLGIVVKGIEPPKKFETNKVRSRFKFPSEKNKTNRLECKILSVVAIAPSQLNSSGNMDQNPMKTQSTPQMMHDTITEKRNSDRRLERLLKYYKVEAQSKINNQIKKSTKSMKALIAGKLSDYLKKLQEDDDDEMLQIQTDDPKVVKLILPFDFTHLACSNSSEIEIKEMKKPKESFSDLYINYSADNIDEVDDDLNSIELSKLENRSRIIESDEINLNSLNSNQCSDSRRIEQKSNTFLNRNSLNFSHLESRSEFPENPIVMGKNNRNSTEFPVMTSKGQSETCENSSTELLEQQKRMTTNTHREKDNIFQHNSGNSLSSNAVAEKSFKISQAKVKDRENIKYEKEVSVTRNTKTMNESQSTPSRNDGKVSLKTSKSDRNTPNNSQIENEQLRNEHKNYYGKKESKKSYNGMSADDFVPMTPNDGDFRQEKENKTEKKNNSTDNFVNSTKPPKQYSLQTMYKQRFKFSAEEEENRRNLSKENKMPFGAYRKEQNFVTIYDGNSESQEMTSFVKTTNPEPPKKLRKDASPTRRYEYFEIPPPKPSRKSRSEWHDDDNNSSAYPMKPDCHADNNISFEPRSSKNSQIPKIISNTARNNENLEKFSSKPQQKKNEEEQYGQDSNKCSDEFNGTLKTSPWNSQKEKNEIDNSLEKCLQWNIRNSETIVISEFNDSFQNKTSETEKNTIIPRKSHIPVARKDQNKCQDNNGRSCIGNENNTTMFLTKSYKVPPGQSSYEKRKMYDTRIRKNIKRRSLSESSGQTKMLPLIYEVRYCNIYNHIPNGFDIRGSRSDQNISNYSTDCDIIDFQQSIDTLTTAPSCYLKENKYGRGSVDLSTEPSCLLKESKYDQEVKKEPLCISTEPSCLLKESKYNITTRKKDQIPNQLPNGSNRNDKENPNNHHLKSGRINELIKENLLYSNYPTHNDEPKFAIGTRKRRKKIEKEKNLTTKITLRCSKKSPRENGKRVKVIAKLKGKRNDKVKETSENIESPQFSDLTELSIDEVIGNELSIPLEDKKLPSVEKKGVFIEKSVVNFAADSEFSDEKDFSTSSKSTLVNCGTRSSVTSKESEETVKELFVTSADDSGYLTKGAETLHSETALDNTNKEKGYSSPIFKTFSKRPEDNSGISINKQTTIEKISKWNQKDLGKLRVQLLFPHVYDDFELLEKARNTDLIKYYLESGNDKLKQAIDSISQKENMSIKSRSVMSLPSVKMIPEEPSFNGDLHSELSRKCQRGGYFNYQKFIAQNNNCYSTNVLSKLSRPEVCGDCADTFKDEDISETCSVKSCDIPSVRSSVTMKKSVIELFKIRPSSAKKSSCSMLSDNETLVEENEEECLSMNNNISDEEFFNNFHQIMAMECQRYAKRVRYRSRSKDSVKDDLEYEEIPLDCLLKNKSLHVESSENYLEQEFQLASDELFSETNVSSESTKRESNESFKSLTCIKPKNSNSKWQNLFKNTRKPGSNSKFNLDFYPQEKISILDMIKTVQAKSLSDDSLVCSPRDKVLSVISSGEVTKQSEKQFFDNLLAFYDKESEFIKKLIRDDEFFTSLIEKIRSSEDTTLNLYNKDLQKKTKKEKKRGILSRFFRWKEKKSTETLFENPSIGKSLEFAQSISNESSSITRESCYSFYKDLEDLEKDINESENPNSKHLQQLAYKAKCHLEPMVKATISNRHISDKIKLAGFLKMLDMVAKGDFTFLSNGDNRSLEEKLREHVAQMFEKVFRIANREVSQKYAILDHDKIQLLKMLVTKYHMGIETHINILGIYIGRGLIMSKTQLEDAIIYLMGQDSQEINLEQLEKNCSIQSG